MRTLSARGRRAAIRILPAIAVAAFALLAPPITQAAETYELQQYGTRCVSGQTDERRFLYVICHDALRENYLRVVDPAGTIVTTLRMPGANDVAPAPDGSYVYVSGGGRHPIRRFNRQANGTYAQDLAYRAPTFRMWGAEYPAKGRQIATDAYGNLYVANGVWTDELLHVVTKFGPDGRYITHFGGFRNTWAFGEFYSLSGIAVSRDGRHIYTTELHNSRVQRFDRQADGSYRFALAFGNSEVTDPYRLGWCVPGLLAAPYDVAVDGWGDVWVTSTSCTYLQKFDKTGRVLYSSFVGNRGTAGPGVLADGRNQNSHNLAVDGRGSVISGETSTWLVRTGPIPAWPAVDALPEPAPAPDPEPAPAPQPAPEPAPAPDAAAPVVNAVTVPATTRTSVIDVVIDATDDRGVATVRMATENGDDWTGWQAFQPTMRFTLRAGIGYRGVYVQVRDAAGRESNIVYRRTHVIANDPAPAPEPEPAPAPQPAPAPEPAPAPQPAPAPEPAPAPQPAPGPDVTAPTLRGVTVPATVVGSAIDVAIDAIDDRGVATVRMATDAGDDWTAWQPFQPTMRFTLRGGIGYRGVYVQVRDTAGNQSAILYRMTRVY